MGAKRIVLDAQVAMMRYQNGESGKLNIDDLTDAYNDKSLVPPGYLNHADGEAWYVGEVANELGESRMMYMGEYSIGNTSQPLILLSKIDEIELVRQSLTSSSWWRLPWWWGCLPYLLSF